MDILRPIARELLQVCSGPLFITNCVNSTISKYQYQICSWVPTGMFTSVWNLFLCLFRRLSVGAVEGYGSFGTCKGDAAVCCTQ